MAYTKTAWLDGQAPPISAANLNKLETQYDEVMAYLTANPPQANGFVARPAGGTTTSGTVILIGPEGSVPSDVGTSGVVGGGAPNYENVIGYSTAFVNTATSNKTTPQALTAPDGNWSWIWGGYDNVVNGWACQVHSYHSKIEAGANHCTISGGSIHTIGTNVAYATIAGGTGHTVMGQAAMVGGGSVNTAAGNYASINGGQSNTAPGAGSSISGGSSNEASGNNSSVAGGTNNKATAVSAAALGGQFNTASGVASTVTGRENTASGPAATAMGRDSVASLHGSEAHSAGKFSLAGDAQYQRLIVRKQTSDANPGALLLDNISARLVLPADTTWVFTAMIVARRSDANDESAAFRVEGVIDRNTASASTTALVGTPNVTVIARDSAAWTVAASASTSAGSLELVVTGEASKTILWVGTVELTCVTG